MADLDPCAQPRDPSLLALVTVLPPGSAAADPSASSDSAIFIRERQVAFLHALAATGVVRSAAARSGVSH